MVETSVTDITSRLGSPVNATGVGQQYAPRKVSREEVLMQRCRIQAKVLRALEKMVSSGIITASHPANRGLLERLVRISSLFTADPDCPETTAALRSSRGDLDGTFKCPSCRTILPRFHGAAECPSCKVAIVSFGDTQRISPTTTGATNTRREFTETTIGRVSRDVDRGGDKKEPIGNLKWTFQTGSWVISSPVVARGTVYFGSFDNCLYAVDADRGRRKWKFETGGQIWGSPVIFRESVLFGSSDGYLYCVNRNSGELKWKFPTGGSIRHSPAIAGRLVICGSEDAHVYAVRVETGRLEWKFKTGGPIQTPPVCADGKVYFGSADGNMYVLR